MLNLRLRSESRVWQALGPTARSRWYLLTFHISVDIAEIRLVKRELQQCQRRFEMLTGGDG